MILMIYVIIFMIYWKCPRYICPLIFIANLVVPDLIPIADEALMLATMFA